MLVCGYNSKMKESTAPQELHSRTIEILSHGGWIPHVWTALSTAACYFEEITVAALPVLFVRPINAR